ncbi:hypothetical protein GCM10011452_00550 [Gemmobacter lanyuensis]|uniref:Uncharacterized protein n=1 Tax=Gemmobacter lanyuensis TaxID=1054497 RepID=A0A918IKL3_9RHOB|nr:hypothetical protein [Gemmobacter lanyuensis]GGW21189.1 hypothetical protein GCM10011452_00550 [Gemmobacter lanyuensis]
MQTTLAFAPTPEDLDDVSFTVPILSFTPPPPKPAPVQTPVAGTPDR